MKQEDLEKIKEKYERLTSIKKKVLKLKEEQQELEQDEKVKRYLKITKILNNDKKYSFYNSEEKDDNSILEIAINSVKVTSTYNLYVYIGTYKKDYVKNQENSNIDHEVQREDKSADYSSYQNIETGDIKNIRVNKRKKFEAENVIIFPDNTKENKETYYDIRNLYFKTAIVEGQETAIEKILSKVK